mmetsp:Transcript_4718/g.20076  ORF Transcript_4718/g.20076 Transcript_4718/m.20076 type:complete len:271 (-) Transcript_4718:381-1193(-)
MRARLVRRRAEKIQRDPRRASRSRRRGAPAKRAARDGGPQPRTRADSNLVPHGSRKAPQSARALGVRRYQARAHLVARAGGRGETHARQAAHVRRAQKSRRRANRGGCLFRVWTFVNLRRFRRGGEFGVRRLRLPDALASARRLRRREQQWRQRRVLRERKRKTRSGRYLRGRVPEVPEKSFRRVVEGRERFVLRAEPSRSEDVAAGEGAFLSRRLFFACARASAPGGFLAPGGGRGFARARDGASRDVRRRAHHAEARGHEGRRRLRAH